MVLLREDYEPACGWFASKKDWKEVLKTTMLRRSRRVSFFWFSKI